MAQGLHRSYNDCLKEEDTNYKTTHTAKIIAKILRRRIERKIEDELGMRLG